MNLDDYLIGKPYTLTQEQYDFCHDVINGDKHVGNFSVAGSGKSLCLEIIKNVLGNTCVVCATTGIANSILFNNKGGMGTCHRVFSLPTTIYNSYHEKKVGRETSQLFASSDLVKTVIIEESGMLNPDQLDLIMKRIDRFNRPYGKKRKKRNIKVVLIADFLQLGSVLPNQDEIDYMRETYGSEFLFDSKPFIDLDMNVHVFTKVLRTNNKVLQAALNVLRYGEEHRYDGVLKWLNKRVLRQPKDALFVTTTNREVDKLNTRSLLLNENPEIKLKAIVEGDYDIRDCPADEVITLKVGCPVISLVNEQEGNFFNGSYGHVVDVYHGEGVLVKFAHSGEEHLVPYFEYEAREYFTNTDPETGEDFMDSRIIGKCTQVSVKLAACFSVFRMQGRTVNSPMVLDLGWGFPEDQDNSWGFAQAYTAISRVTDIEHLYLKQKLTKKHLKVNKRAVEWVKARMK